jgi:hypothetical protein
MSLHALQYKTAVHLPRMCGNDSYFTATLAKKNGNSAGFLIQNFIKIRPTILTLWDK